MFEESLSFVCLRGDGDGGGSTCALTHLNLNLICAAHSCCVRFCHTCGHNPTRLKSSVTQTRCVPTATSKRIQLSHTHPHPSAPPFGHPAIPARKSSTRHHKVISSKQTNNTKQHTPAARERCVQANYMHDQRQTHCDRCTCVCSTHQVKPGWKATPAGTRKQQARHVCRSRSIPHSNRQTPQNNTTQTLLQHTSGSNDKDKTELLLCVHKHTVQLSHTRMA